MKCVICKLNIHPSDFDIGYAFETVNPISFRVANMHSDCFEDALDIAAEMPAKNIDYENRQDEYITTKL